jgi:hypothetical protein
MPPPCLDEIIAVFPYVNIKTITVDDVRSRFLKVGPFLRVLFSTRRSYDEYDVLLEAAVQSASEQHLLNLFGLPDDSKQAKYTTKLYQLQADGSLVPASEEIADRIAKAHANAIMLIMRLVSFCLYSLLFDDAHLIL